MARKIGPTAAAAPCEIGTVDPGSRRAAMRAIVAWQPALRELAGVLGLSLMNGLYLVVGPLIAGVWSDEARLDTREVGLLMTLQLVSGAAAAIGLSGHMDRVAPRRLGLAAGLALVATNGWFACRLDFGSLMAGSVAAGGLLGCLNACALGALAETGTPARTAAIASVAGTAATALMAVPVAHLTEMFGAWGLFGAQSVVGVAGMGLTAVMAGTGTRVAAPPAMPLLRAARSPFVVSAIFIELATAGVWAFTERIGTRIGLGPGAVGDIVAAASLCGIGGAIAATLAARWRLDAALALLSTAAFGAAASLVPAAADPIWFAAALGAQAFCFVFTWPFVTAIGVAVDRSGGLAVAAHGWGLLAAGVAPLAGGWIVEPDRFGRLTDLGLWATALAVGALALAAYRRRGPRSAGGPPRDVTERPAGDSGRHDPEL